jgi:tRNA-processing RNAse BN (EC 3.1.-.-)
MNTHVLRFYHFLVLVAKRFIADGSNQTAASLTYTSLLAIVPLITIGLTIFSAFPAFTEISTSLKVFLLNNMVPEAAGKVITVYMFQFSENAGKLTAIGTVLLAVTAFMLMQTIEHALNGIWHVRRARPLAQRFLVYWSILTLGPLLIGTSLYVTSYLASLALGLGHQVHGMSLFLLKLVPVLLTVSAMSLLYLTVPNRYVPTRHAWVGGLVAGLSFEAMNCCFPSTSAISRLTLWYTARSRLCRCFCSGYIYHG